MFTNDYFFTIKTETFIYNEIQYNIVEHLQEIINMYDGFDEYERCILDDNYICGECGNCQGTEYEYIE